MKDQIPGGMYVLGASIRKVLSELKPNNDVCESILGHNDYLTTAIPNLHQMAHSNIVQMKNNHTMKWLHKLPSEQQLKVLDLAVKDRQKVAQQYKRERDKQRRQNMLQAHIKRRL